MDDRIFCPGCGMPIDHPGRSCPSCHEPLPAPKTVVGFGDLPDDLAAATGVEPDGPIAPIPPPASLVGGLESEPAPPTHRYPGRLPDAAVVGSEVIAVPPVLQPLAFQADIAIDEPSIGSAPTLDADGRGATNPGFPGPAAAQHQVSILGAPAPLPSPQTPLPAAEREPEAEPQVAPPMAPPVAAPQPPPAQAQPFAPPAQAQPFAHPPQAQPFAPPPQAQPFAHPPQAQPFAPPPQAQPFAPPPQAQPFAPPAQGQAWAPPEQPMPVQGDATKPHKGPPAEAMVNPPGQRPFVYGQPIAADAGPPVATVEAGPLAPELAPTDTRKGLVWRTVAGGALLSWSLIFGLSACGFVLMHLALCLEHGFDNLHEVTYTTFGLSAGALFPAALLMLASVSCLTGRGWPRVLAVLAAVAHGAWAGVTVYLLNQTFTMTDTALYGAAAVAGTALISLVGSAVMLAGGRWIAKSLPGMPARAVPYPLWAGPMLIVFGTIFIVHQLAGLGRVVIKLVDNSRIKHAMYASYDSVELFAACMAGLLLSVVLVVAGAALLRRKPWSVALGGTAGLLMLVADVTAIVVLYFGYETSRYGGPWLAMVDVFVLLAFGIAAWIAVAGALRFGFRLPRYIRNAPEKGPDGKRLPLLRVLVGGEPDATRH